MTITTYERDKRINQIDKEISHHGSRVRQLQNYLEEVISDYKDIVKQSDNRNQDMNINKKIQDIYHKIKEDTKKNEQTTNQQIEYINQQLTTLETMGKSKDMSKLSMSNYKTILHEKQNLISLKEQLSKTLKNPKIFNSSKRI